MATKTSSHNMSAEIAFLIRALKAPSLAVSVERPAERARADSWSHEEFLIACLQREVAAREAHGGEGRIRAARFPAAKRRVDFDFDDQCSLKFPTEARSAQTTAPNANTATGDARSLISVIMRWSWRPCGP